MTITGTNDAPTVVAEFDHGEWRGNRGHQCVRRQYRNVGHDRLPGPRPHRHPHRDSRAGFVDVECAPAGFTDNSTYIGQFSLTPATVVNGTVAESADTINTASVGWTFTLDDDDPTLQSLAAGQTITQVYTVTVYDGHVGGTVTQDVTVTITGTEDAPTITTATTEALTSGAVVEDGKQSTSGAITFQDVDLIDTHSLSQALTGGSASTTLPGFNPATQPLGTLALKLNEDNADTDNTGTVDWTFTIDNALAQQLAAGQVITQTYTVTIDDGHTGGTVTQDITVTITGTNDTPVVATADVTGGVTELVTPVGNLSDSGTIGFTDVDLIDTHSIEPTIVASPGALGTLTASVTTDTTGTGLGGVVTWDYQVAASAVEYLGEGKTKVEHFTITLDDGHGGTVERTVEVTITGTNDASSIVGETNPPTIGVMVVNPVSPTIEPAGQNTNTLGLANESFDGQTSGSVSNNGTGTGNFTSADLGATFTASGHAGIVHGSSSVSAAPFMGPQPGSQDTSNYLSIGADATETITFTTDKNSFGLYWGSVNSYNTIDFYEGDTLVASYTGADIVPLLASGNQGLFTANGYVEFSGLPHFNKVVLGTGGSNAFEIDNISAGSGPVAHATLQGPLSGTLSVHDVDIGDTLTGVVSADATVRYNNSSTLPNGVNVADLIKAGNLTFDSVESDGGTDTLHWNYDPHGANLDFLHAGDVLEITYTAQVSDGHGSYGNQQVTVTLVGTNSQTTVSALTVVDGTSGNDTFNNVGGNTTVLGNGGHDNFVFKPGSGSATIADFDPANDTITFASSMFNHNPANVLLAAHDDGHGNTVISLNATDTITLSTYRHRT